MQGAHYLERGLRELIVSAVCHRNCSIVDSRIRIVQLGDRLGFTPPGRLANMVTLKKVKCGASYASSPVILRFLENMRYIDKLGRGIPMVCQEAKKLNRPVTFEGRSDEFVVLLGFISAVDCQ